MSGTLPVVIGLLAILGVAFIGAAQHDPQLPPAWALDETAEGLTTMYRIDPMSNAMNFSGVASRVIQDNEMRNRHSDMDYGNFRRGHFTVGIEGGREGAILDLGPARDLAERYGFQETVGGGQGYASIHLRDGEWHTHGGRMLREAQGLAPSRGINSVPVVQSHLYLVRITDRHDGDFDRRAVFMVVGHEPDESVTIRWRRLQ